MSNIHTRNTLSLKVYLGLTVLAGIMTTPIAQATSVSGQDAIKNLNQLLSNTKSMRANFHQTTKSGKKTRTFSGTMAVQRQNQLRWETQSPAEQLIVANEHTMWIYDKDLKQVMKRSVVNQVGDTPALLLSGDVTKIANNFNVSQPNDAKNYFKLTPKSGNADFKELYISFNGGKPVMMVLNDSMGQRTDIRFSNIILNKKIDDNQFSFTPPQGVEVIN